MAGEWIKMRVGLTTNPHVLRIAEHLLTCPEYVEWAGLSWGLGGYPPLSREEADNERYVALRVTRYVTVTALLKFWGYANEHAKGDFIDGIRAQDVLEITGIPGFASALEAAGWVEFDQEDGGVRMPNFEEHNTGHRERTSAGAERQKRYRERKKSDSPSDVTRDVTVTEREEKRREEKKDKAQAPLIPDWMPMEAWTGYLEMRAKLKKAPTPRAVVLVIKSLDAMRAKGIDVAQVLDNSTKSNWTDVYEPKGSPTAQAESGIGRFI